MIQTAQRPGLGCASTAQKVNLVGRVAGMKETRRNQPAWSYTALRHRQEANYEK